MGKFLKFLIVFIICGYAPVALAQNVVLRGKVLDEKNQPIPFAIVNLTNIERYTYTDTLGNFNFSIPSKTQITNFEFKISYVGKKAIEVKLPFSSTTAALIFKMQDLSLTLKDVEVNQIRKTQNSNSSIVFDRQALEQSQAFSLADVLNNLPGKKLIAPDLQNPQTITLRSEATGIQSLSNSLGIAIIIDDIQQSNNANMQNKNVSKWGVGSTINSVPYGSFDTPFGGLDLRDIPVDNIESVEVIQGVAPAKYGDLTDGAIIINRQAGKTPYQFSTRINGGSTNFSLSKGYKLNKRWGALNFSANYLNSNENPSDKTKVYDRLSGNLMWTSYLLKGLKNTLSVDYSYKIDNVKIDPDDGFEIRTYSKARNLSVSNRTSININNNVVKSLNMSIGYSSGYQETYNQRYLNGATKGITDKDTSGEIYEGYFIPGNYLSVENIAGKPLNFNGNIGLSNEIYTGKLLHQITVGGNAYYSRNAGMGVIVDPSKPRWANTAYQNDRPYDFESLPDIINYGAYVQDNFKFKFFKRELNFNLGLRYDVQNAQGNIQPRLSANYKLSDDIEVNSAYGISTKGPTLAHRYPAPTYIDLILLNKYTGYVNESILLVYTDRIIADNSNLKSSQSNQFELGFKMTKPLFSTSLFGYFKHDFNGFSNNTVYNTYVLPQYDYTYVQGARPIVTPNGSYTKRYVGINTVGNDLDSKNYGLEWALSFKKIEAIQTSFSLNTSFNYSLYHNSAERVIPTSQANIDLGKVAWFGIYPANEYYNWNLMSKFSATTHIPKLGFVVNLLADISWQTVSKTLADSYLPIAYYDVNMIRHNIPAFDRNNAEYGYLSLTSAANSKTKLPFSYVNMSIRISKEIKQNLRISVNAYNFLNVRYRYYNPDTNSVTTYSYPTSVGAELSIKF
ncbi:TonB-dependent receptor domain-containing protein [Pedobacter miscanthi]|uniref:TonB-dependent receptor n=1 Tax=Pedobacter miscanthi TaxID=2259170 RepID=UPI002930108D|nr:TonB-dependent receptor [Pedobacter miscanthi]